MGLTEYQTAAAEYALYEDVMYPVASLMVEAAELADLFIKPLLRGDEDAINRKEVISEAGDVLWNLANLLADFDVSLEHVAQYNLQKLEDRKARGVIKGSGGSR